MKLIDRNPDVKLDEEDIPNGLILFEGKNLMHTARSKSIPFGVATNYDRTGTIHRRITIGILIRESDAEQFKKALERKSLNQKS